MKRHLLFYACLLAAVTATAASRTATEAYVTNRVTQATNALHEAIAPTIDYSTNNTTLVATIEAKAPAPDFTTNNVVLTNTIAQVAPAPGNYEVVSNRAMQISMPGDEEHPGGLLFIPYFDGRAKEAHDAYDLIHSRQSRDPGQLTLKQRGQEDSGGAVWGVWWPAFLDAWSVWHWVASEDYVDAATNGLIGAKGGAITNGTLTVGDSTSYVMVSKPTGNADPAIEVRNGNSGVLKIFPTYFQKVNEAGDAYSFTLPNSDGILATTDDIPNLNNYATKSYADGAASTAVTSVSNKVEETSAIVNTWETYWGGTNVVMEVTNYYGNTTGTLPRLRIREYRDGAWTNVWDEVNKFEVCKVEILHDVDEKIDEFADVSATNYAPIAWGRVTDKGTPNPETNTVYMTSPQTYFGGGTEYQRIAVGSGAICVLVDRGALAHTAGEPGTFRFQDDGGTNFFGFAKSDSYTIGCRTDGITVGTGNLITLRYDVIMAGTDVPIVYWKENLSDPTWAQLNNVDGTAASGAPHTVTWLQEGGSYYANINCGNSPGGFFKAETSVAGDVVFETNMKARLGGGIECTNTATHAVGIIRPSYNGSTVTWTWSAR